MSLLTELPACKHLSESIIITLACKSSQLVSKSKQMLQRSDVVTIYEVPVSLNRSLFVASPRNGYRLAFSHSPMNTSVSAKQYESTFLASHMCRNRMEAILPRLQRSAARSSDPGKACAILPGAQHPPDDFSKGTSANVGANSERPEFVFCTISLGRRAS